MDTEDDWQADRGGFSGRSRYLAIALIAAVLVFIPVWQFDIYVSRGTAVREGEVVTFRTHARDSGVSYSTTVRLETGEVVSAGNRTGAATPVGARVELTERTGWLTGMRRYSVRKVLPAPPRPRSTDPRDRK